VSERYDVVGTGSMVVDVIHLVPRIVGPDEKLLVEPEAGVEPVRRFVGGVALNHLGWARILGLRVALFGRQADDEHGRFLRAGMDRIGIAHELDLGGSASSCSEVFVGERGERCIYMLRGATAELGPADVEQRFAGLIERADCFTTEISQVPLAAVRRALEIARAAGVRTVVDLDQPASQAVPALGTREELEAVLSLADVIKPAELALRGLVEADAPERAAEQLGRRFGARAVAVTLGERGALIWAEGETALVPAPAARVVDTTGAGDAFLGGFVAGLHLGLDWERAARVGNACGAACCEQVGAFPDDPVACRERIARHLASLGEGSLELPRFSAGAAEGAAGADGGLERFLATAVDEVGAAARAVSLETVRATARLLLEAERKGGRVHVTGVGKPEHVARYAAALLASTGTPATFLHGTEATHGSVGQLCPGDVVIAISNSGETRELLAAVDAARGLGAGIVAVTGNPDSSLARAADRVLLARIEREGGPLGLAPRASILAETLVLQALSVELQAARQLTRDAYHLRHPAGALGRRSGSPEEP
jgi:arabinose-5-phosphate isomerase